MTDAKRADFLDALGPKNLFELSGFRVTEIRVVRVQLYFQLEGIRLIHDNRLMYLTHAQP